MNIGPFKFLSLVAAGLIVGCQSSPESEPEAEAPPAKPAAPPKPTVVFEVGRLSVDSSWQTVNLKQNFKDPIVVAKPASFQGPDPTTIRLRNAGPKSFDIRLEEWAYLNDTHGAEDLSYLAVERGRHRLAGDIAVEAGSLETSNTLPGSDPFVKVSFSKPFRGKPIVLSIVATDAGETAVVTRHQHVTGRGFEVILQEEEAQGGHGTETIHWIAWKPGTSDVGKIPFEAAFTKGVSHRFTPISFSYAFSGPPCVVGDMQTMRGDDPSNLRYTKLTASGIELKVHDEQSADKETQHGREEVGWIAFGCGQ